jgi:CDP-diacylglycerol--glycerol-3-phosphate 3-phosphatidyltransferase
VRKIRIAISPRFATRTFENGAMTRVFSPPMAVADWFTVARAAAAPFVVLLFEWDFPNHDYWATALFAVAMATDWFDGQLARRSGRASALGSLLDPVADKLLVLSVLIVLVDQGIFEGWIVAAIVARELLVSGLRLAALERGRVLQARDLGKLKTWAQALAALLGGLAAAGAVDQTVAWWALLVALVLTWLSGLDYARLAPSLLREPAPAAGAEAGGAESTFSSNPASRQTLS